MMTLYCYEELPFRVQQEVDKKVKQTTAYKKYVERFYKERLTEILGQDFTSSEVTADIVTVYSLDDVYKGELEPWIDVFKSINYDLDNRKILVNILVDETNNYNALHDFISAITHKFGYMMQNIMNEAISIEPDMGQFLTDKTFTEDGKEVEISFK
jgi:hypothetical protein